MYVCETYYYNVGINFVTEKVLLTPPLNGLILPGILRQSVIELAKQWNEFYIEERVITMDEVVRLQKRGRVSIFLACPYNVKILIYL